MSEPEPLHPHIISNKEIGRRLVTLRKALSRDTGQDWSQRDVARHLNMSQNMVLRAERGHGTMVCLIRMLGFYRIFRFNVDWVLAPDNKDIPMWLDEGEIDQKLEKITALKSFIQGMGL